jgi:D-proline reductase (dithiol) PrdB
MAGNLRLKNRIIAKVLGSFPFLERFFTALYKPPETESIPWTPADKALRMCTVALVTTAGVHMKDQKPFDMTDKRGDPSYRVLDSEDNRSGFTITHDYYDHADADRDINVVLPIDRLREFEAEGIIGRCAVRHYGFMGHVIGDHIHTLTGKTAPEAARRIKSDGADIVLLTPG